MNDDRKEEDKEAIKKRLAATDSGRRKSVWLGESEDEWFEAVAVALGHRVRRKILRMLATGSYSVAQIAQKLDIPVTTVHFNVNVLEQAGLVGVTENSASRGKEHIVSRKVDRVVFELMMHPKSRTFTYTYDIPIGSYFEAKIVPPCGMVGVDGIIGEYDSPSVFFSGARQNAQLLWASGGRLEYRIPNDSLRSGKTVNSLSVSLELCSEIPNYQNDWRSDITFWLNGVELCTYTSPGDFGGRRGRLNPEWWSEGNTQYGLLVNITLKENIVYLNEIGVASVKPEQLKLSAGEYFTFAFGVKEKARNAGGFNLFGEKFGDYAQNIVVTVDVD